MHPAGHFETTRLEINMKRLLTTLYNIARHTLIGWYNIFNHVVDGLERYENTCKKREKTSKRGENEPKTEITKVPWR